MTDNTSEVLRLARGDFTVFKQVMNAQYERAIHLDLLDKAVMEVVRYLETGVGIQRLIVEMPPRHGKSLTVSQFLPAWLLGRNPWAHVMLISYSAALAEDNSRAARNMLDTNYFRGMFPDVNLSQDNKKVENWGVEAPNGVSGGVYAAGLDGSITGQGSHCLIIDDPHKNRAEAESATRRENVWNTYTNDLLSRFNDSTRAAQIIMATRWHTDDLTGRVITLEGEKWHRLRLPALAEETDLLGRAEGEALWPVRHPSAALEEVRQKSGEYVFSSLYQQSPIPRGKTVFNVESIEVVDSIPTLKHEVRFYDLAVSKKRSADFSVGLHLGIADNEDIYILDVWRRKVAAPVLLKGIIDNAMRDGRGVPIILEAERMGIASLDFMLDEPRLRGFQMRTQGWEGDKLIRAAAIITRVDNGRVKLKRGYWNAEFLEELSLFPAGAHDDQVDAFSGAYRAVSDVEMPTSVATSLGKSLF